MPKTAVLRARVDAELVRQLDEVVSVSTGDRSDHIRQALEIYIKDQRMKRRFLRALDEATVGDDDPLGVIPSE